MFLSRIRLWAPSKHAGRSISSGIYVVTAETETGCPRPPGRFPCWRPCDASGGSGAPEPGKPRLQPCHPLRTRHGARAPGNIESGHVGVSWPRCASTGSLFLAACASWRPAAPQIRHCAGRHRMPVARTAAHASGMHNPVTAGASRLVCAFTGPCWGPAVLLGWVRRGFLLPPPPPGGFTVLDPGKLRWLPGRLPRWPNPWTGPFSGAETLRAKGRERRREESR